MSSSKKDTLAAGTIHGCRRWSACGGAATRPRRFASSAIASASPSARTWSTSRSSSTPARGPQPARAAHHGRAPAPESRARELSGRSRRRADVVNNPENPSAGTRKVPFCRVLYIERDDFRENPPKKFFRLAPGREVRLRNAYFITCNDVVKDQRPARSSSCDARTIRPRAAATRPTAARSRPRCTGFRPRTLSRRKSGFTIVSSTRRCRVPAAATAGLTSTRRRSSSCARRASSRAPPDATRHSLSVRASRLLLRRPRLHRRPPTF